MFKVGYQFEGGQAMNMEIASFNNTFFEYLCSFIWFDPDRLMAMMRRYLIGATEQREPIFWHINTEHKITNGHVITMSGDTGKVYDDSWYRQDGRPMCLFGEHLLKDFPDKTVALVKDEMTAAIMSCFPTPYVWLATGKGDVTPTDLLPLKRRAVIVFPEKGEHDKWQETLRTVPDIHFHISDVMEKSQGDSHDIAQVVLSQQPLRPTEEEAALLRMEATCPNLRQLVEALDLEVMRMSIGEDPAKDLIQETGTAMENVTGSKVDETLQTIKATRKEPWHGRNLECHECGLSHEGLNGTYCGKLHQYVEYGKMDCGR